MSAQRAQGRDQYELTERMGASFCEGGKRARPLADLGQCVCTPFVLECQPRQSREAIMLMINGEADCCSKNTADILVIGTRGASIGWG